MSPGISDADLNALAVPSILDAARADWMVKAAQNLRLAQAWAGCYAALLEGGTCTLDDIVKADAGYTAAVARSGEAIRAMAELLTSQGTA